MWKAAWVKRYGQNGGVGILPHWLLGEIGKMVGGRLLENLLPFWGRIGDFSIPIFPNFPTWIPKTSGMRLAA